ITDRGKPFVSRLFKDTLRSTHSLHRKTSAYHPQSNGLVEKFNRTLTDMLSVYVNETHSNWDELLPFVTFAYNSAVQSSSGFPPFRLLYGRDPTTPIDALLSSLSVIPSASRIQQSLANLSQDQAQAKAAIEKAQLNQQAVYNATHSEVIYRPGDLVLLRYPLRQIGLASKLLRKYCGPFSVLRQVSPVNYEVIPHPALSSRNERQIVHVSRMKKYHSRFRDEIDSPGGAM